MRLQRTRGSGDPDLHGAFYPAALDFFSKSGFDFQETSVTAHAAAVVALARWELPDAALNATGVVICVNNYADVAEPATGYDLRVLTSRCPNGFTSDGAPLVCGTKADAPSAERRGECGADGACACAPPYAPPVPEEALFPGLGFASCAARVVNATAALEAPFSADDERVGAGAWAFYAVDVADDEFQVAITVAESGTASAVGVFAKFGAPAGAEPGQFDARPEWNAAAGGRVQRLDLRRGDDAFRPGLPLFVGVVGRGDGESAFAIEVAKYACPNGCSGNGACDAATNKCACAGGFGGDDCALATAPLAWGEPLVRNGTAGAGLAFEYEFYELPPVTAAMLNGSVEVVIEAQFAGGAPGRHLDASPAVLVGAWGVAGAFPSATNFTHRLVLQRSAPPQRLTLCASQLVAGPWKLALWNPLPTVPLESYSVTAHKIGRCPGNGCAGHGECLDDGVCVCAEGFLGAACDVDAAAIPGGGGGKKGLGGGGTFLLIVLCLALGAASMLAFIHAGLGPLWLRARDGGAGIGLYQELTE
jgi:hypothetical protein